VTKVFPALIITLFIGAALGAAWSGERKKFVFYAASAAINVVVL